MQLSERGYRKIKSYEGYGRKLPDGGCTAYQERINGKLDIPTIGYGCTSNVKMGDVWSRDKAEDALRAEIAKHEARVVRLVTVDINQNEFDALVSFDFNTGGLAKSTVLKRLNADDRHGAAQAFGAWNKFGGKASRALTARRASEAALFLEPVGEVAPDYMPQGADEARRVGTGGKLAAGGVAGTAALEGAKAVVDKGKEVRTVVEDAKGLVPPVPKDITSLLPVGAGLLVCGAIVFAVLHLKGR